MSAMEVILDVFFERLEAIDRNCLHSRCNRRSMVDYFNTLIEGCRLAFEQDYDCQETVREAVLGIINFHDSAMKENGNVCRMGKYHNVLYVGIKICFDWQLRDKAIIKQLLDRIFTCEKTFERLMVGALFGTRAPHFIAGWKSDFDNQEENLLAVVFFADAAMHEKLTYKTEEPTDILYRFIDVPIESCGKSSAVKIMVQLGLCDKLLIFLRFGASLFNPLEYEETVVDTLLDKLTQYKRKYPYNYISCLQMVLRVVPSLPIGKRKGYDREENNSNVQKDYILDNFEFLVRDSILPLESCGIVPPKLKHLCRCTVRDALFKAHQLPNGIQNLPVPIALRRYVDILED